MSSSDDSIPAETAPGFIKEMAEDECYQRLSTTTVGRIAFVGDDGLQLLPVNFRVLGRTIFFRTAADSVLASLAHGTIEVAFGVDYHEDLYRTGWNITAHGTPAQADAASATEAMAPSHGLRPWAPGARDVVIALTPSSIAGRRVRGY